MPFNKETKLSPEAELLKAMSFSEGESSDAIFWYAQRLVVLWELVRWHVVHCFTVLLKALQMNVQHCQILKLILYNFELGHNPSKAAKNICCAKGDAAVDQRTVTRWLTKFRSGYKDFDRQTRSGRPQTMDSEAVLQVIEANQVSHIRRVSGELSVFKSSMVHHLHKLGKSIRNELAVLRVTKNIAKLLIHPSKKKRISTPSV